MTQADQATFDRAWEERYKANPRYRSYYPWTAVVSFVFGYAPRDRDRSSVRVLEVGCGSGNNLWFLAREGFNSAGVDGSETAIAFAKDRLSVEGLNADLRVVDFAQPLPFADTSFDLVFDRAALTFTTANGAAACIGEIHRVLKPDGAFLFNPYSDRDSSCRRAPNSGGDVQVAMIKGGSRACFYSADNIRDLLGNAWVTESFRHWEEEELAGPERVVHSEWLVIARKKTVPAI